MLLRPVDSLGLRTPKSLGTALPPASLASVHFQPPGTSSWWVVSSCSFTAQASGSSWGSPLCITPSLPMPYSDSSSFSCATLCCSLSQFHPCLDFSALLGELSLADRQLDACGFTFNFTSLRVVWGCLLSIASKQLPEEFSCSFRALCRRRA